MHSGGDPMMYCTMRQFHHVLDFVAAHKDILEPSYAA